MTYGKTEKIILVALIMNKYNYEKNETIARRINNYNFRPYTSITYDDKHIKISTQIGIKGVQDVLILFPDGMSKLEFEFN